jgi:RNA polymerase sigma-70 factor, ECF subfamily
VELEHSITEALGRRAVDEAASLAIRGYGPQILGYLRSVVRDAEDAAEVFSQFAEDLWKGLAAFRGECTVRVWAYKLAWHAASRFARDPYRRRAQRLGSTMASQLAETLLSSASGEADRRAAEVDRLRRQLTPEEQTLLVLRLDRKLSWREVAEVLDEEGRTVDEPTLRKRYERLKDKLVRIARDEGLLDDDGDERK